MTDDKSKTPGMAEVSAKFVHKVDPVIDAIDRAISLDTKAQQAEGQEADQVAGEAVAAQVKAVQTSAMSMGGLVAKARFVYRIEAEQAPSHGPVDESMAPKVAEHTRPLDAPFLLWSLLRDIEALAGATEDPVLVLEREWHVRRERLHNEPDETDAVRDPLAKAATDVEFAIHRTPATTLEGVAVKLRLWARIAYPGWTAPAGQEWWKIPVADMHGFDHMPVASALQDLEREIVETGEVVRENGHIYLVARVSSDTLDSLATFETSREDLEEEPDAEQVNEDGTNESSYDGDARGPDHRRYLAGRQEQYRANRAKDQDELRKVKRQVNALAAKKRKRVKA